MYESLKNNKDEKEIRQFSADLFLKMVFLLSRRTFCWIYYMCQNMPQVAHEIVDQNF